MEDRPAALRETLSQRLERETEAVRARNPAYIAAVERFARRLTAARTGQGAPGPGEAMPAFTMPDHDGRLVGFEALLGHGPVVLIFHRGHWCPFCKASMAAFAEIQDDLAPATILAISPQIQRYSRELRERSQARFRFLTDLDAGYALSLGIAVRLDDELVSHHRKAGRDIKAYHGGGDWVVPIPAVFVLNSAGVVRARHVDPDYRNRMELDTLIAAVRAAG